MAATMTAPKATQKAAGDPVVRSEAFKRLKSETLILSRDKAVQAARDHQLLPNSPTERELEPKRVKELVGRLKDGVWIPCSWATVEFNGVKYRMNGQHSSHAMLEAADYLPDELAIHLDHYRAETGEQMAALFRQFDARFSARSKADVSGAYQGLIPEIRGISRGKAKLCIEGVAWYERAIEGLPVPSGDELYSMFFANKYHGFIRWADKILSIKTPEMQRAPIVGAMYATFIASESGAQEFWSHVAKQDLADDSDPRSVLAAELVRVKEGQKDAQPPTPAEFYAKCVKAWNAFRSGDKIRSLNVNTKKGLPELAA